MFYCIADIYVHIIMIVAATLLAIALLVIVIIACKLRRKLQSAARFAFYFDIYAILQLYCFLLKTFKGL